jgi:hypothetical protein
MLISRKLDETLNSQLHPEILSPYVCCHVEATNENINLSTKNPESIHTASISKQRLAIVLLGNTG